MEKQILVAEDATMHVKTADWIIVFERFSDGQPFMRLAQFRGLSNDGNGVIVFDANLIYPSFIRCADVDNWHSTALKNHVLDVYNGRLYKKYPGFEITPLMTGHES